MGGLCATGYPQKLSGGDRREDLGAAKARSEHEVRSRY